MSEHYRCNCSACRGRYQTWECKWRKPETPEVLEYPACGAQDSFASFMPVEYTDEFNPEIPK